MPREQRVRETTRKRPYGVLALVVAVVGATILTGGQAMAVPPPPPNPSDAEINSSQSQANARAAEVGQLTNELAQAESRLSELEADVQLKMEEANKALVDLEMAQDAASQAKKTAEDARLESDAAGKEIDVAREKMNKFVSSSYQQGSTIGSISAYFGADSPKDLLARAQLLEAVSTSQLNALEGLQRAQTEKSNKDSFARKALEIAKEKEAEADQAKKNADGAQSVAVQAQDNQQQTNNQLQSEKTSVEQRLYEAQSKVSGLQGQRQKYQDWLAQKQREEEAQAAKAAGVSQGGGGPAKASKPSGPAGTSIEAIIARAMSQRGLPYAWGGGNIHGPTRGIRDGGVADRFGDYRKIGFDCSGLMIYAFAGIKAMPHYSGYQYNAGRKVPLSQMRRGDMLFWGGSSRGIHHVALYLGNGQMIEAPHSGSVVKVSPVRYGGIMPFATRLVG